MAIAPPTFVADELVTAAKMNLLPKGVLGYALRTTTQTGITAETDLTGLSVTVTVGASRLLRVTGGVAVAHTVTAGISFGNVKESTTTFGRYLTLQLAAGAFMRGEGSVLITPTVGSHTYKLTLGASAGTTATTASATDPAFILVEDLGAV